MRLPAWLTDGLILTIANIVAAVGNYGFQALMRRHLTWSEFGYLNSTLSLILFASVPLTAASQTMTHHLAQIGEASRMDKVAQLQAASLKLLRYLTWIVFGLCLLLVPPLTEYLHFPRESLAWAGLLWIPVNLWSTLGGAWCAGLSRFRLLSALLIAAAFLRYSAGLVAVTWYPWAEAGIAATILSGTVLAALAVFSPHHATVTSLRRVLLQQDWLLYAGAALAVSFGALAFFQGDQLLAQRHFSGEQLGRYSGAGLLGRTIVWASAPVLTVYFTRRSSLPATVRSPRVLIRIYFGMLSAGALAIFLFRDTFLQLFLGVHDADLSNMTSQFVLAMIPIGILQLMGCHYLAKRCLPECLAFAGFAVAYLAAQSLFGKTPALMLATMTEGATISIAVLLLISAAGYRRPLMP